MKAFCLYGQSNALPFRFIVLNPAAMFLLYLESTHTRFKVQGVSGTQRQTTHRQLLLPVRRFGMALLLAALGLRLDVQPVQERGDLGAGAGGVGIKLAVLVPGGDAVLHGPRYRIRVVACPPSRR